MPAFIPGLTLSHRFFEEAVQPLLANHFPALSYSAALIGAGSEVLGFDTEQSSDHGWGPRCQVFLTDADHAGSASAVHDMLAQALPVEFLGYSTNFERENGGSWVPAPVQAGPVAHRVEITTVSAWCRSHLGRDPRGGMSAIDWLCVPQQRLLTTIRGAVFHDELGQLAPLRERLGYYPRDLWLYLLSAQWMRIGQHEPFIGRTARAGDEAGSRLVAARLVNDAMRLAFLLERCYWPYEKWFGTAFRELACAGPLLPHIEQALSGHSWQAREQGMSPLYEHLAAAHNALGLGPPLSATVSRFHARPFDVIHAERFAHQALAAIEDEAVERLPPYVGSIDQFVGSTDVLERPELWERLRAVYGRDSRARRRVD